MRSRLDAARLIVHWEEARARFELDASQTPGVSYNAFMAELSEQVAARYRDGGYRRCNPLWHSEDSAWKAAQVLDILRRNSIWPSSVVDIGCGAGQVIAELHVAWPEAKLVGWDISSDAAAAWVPNPEATELRHGDFRTDESHYDVAVMLDVLEHVPDYIGLLADAKHIADKIVIHIPLEMNVSSVARKRYLHSREQVGHIHYFSFESAMAAIADADYRIIDYQFTSGAKELRSAQRTITHVANVLRSAVELIGVRHASTVLGGYSLLVLASP